MKYIIIIVIMGYLSIRCLEITDNNHANLAYQVHTLGGAEKVPISKIYYKLSSKGEE